LQSRALQLQPDNRIALFNRAITAERLFLYKQGLEDWERYLGLDTSGEWSDEARERHRAIQTGVALHDWRTKAPLLTPEEFVKAINLFDPPTWEQAEPRIEEYLASAVTDWLPAAFPTNADEHGSLEARKALKTLGAILRSNHADRWLADVLPKRASTEFAHAVAALSNAVRADNITEDYVYGRRESVLAAKLFRDAGNEAGAERAMFEEVYALHFSDLP